MQANVVMIGTAQPSGGGVAVTVAFVDPRTGDELPVDDFSVADDKQHKEAAAQITAGLEEQGNVGHPIRMVAGRFEIREPVIDRLSDPGMNDGFERSTLRVDGEHSTGEGPPVELALGGEDLVAKTRANRRVGRLARAYHVPGDRVG